MSQSIEKQPKCYGNLVIPHLPDAISFSHYCMTYNKAKKKTAESSRQSAYYHQTIVKKVIMVIRAINTPVKRNNATPSCPLWLMCMKL